MWATLNQPCRMVTTASTPRQNLQPLHRNVNTRCLANQRQAVSIRSNPRSQQQLARLPRPRVLVCQAAKKEQFSSFDDMIAQSSVPVLVDFYATWCGPCQMMSQGLAELSKQLDGDVKVVKIDTDKYPGIASKHNVSGLPTLILFRDGRPIDRIEGFMPEPQLLQRVRYYLAGAKMGKM